MEMTKKDKWIMFLCSFNGWMYGNILTDILNILNWYSLIIFMPFLIYGSLKSELDFFDYFLISMFGFIVSQILEGFIEGILL